MKTNRILPAIFLYGSLGLILLFTCIPIYLMVKIAFADPGAFMNDQAFEFTFEHLKAVFLSGNLWPALRKSFTVACATAFLSTLIAAPGAYVLAKIPGRTGYFFLMAIFFTRMFPEVGIALPISLNVARLGLFDTDAGLVLAHLIRVLPLVAWVLIGTFKSLPKDIEEAGRMDGCSKAQVLWRIVLPVARPGIMVGLIFGFLNSWDEFIYAAYLSLMNKTLPLTVFYYVNRGGWFLSSMYALIVTIPVLFFTYFFQRYLQSGYLSGAVKG
ncbi:MAG: carbohydrate ABC transporter permease [Deltaproteobacteria bacterium]|nr:carbohydrate ABC transporter permease [Deltaproteobacteria bacterium]